MVGPVQGRLVALSVALGLALPAMAQDLLPPREASPLTVRQIHSGHSLTDTYMTHPHPGRLVLATALRPGTRAGETIIKSTIPGAPFHWRWNHPTDFPDARKDIGRFELLVTTESVPLSPDTATFADWTLAHLDRWVAHAWAEGNGGKGAEVMLYSTWINWSYTSGVPDWDKEGGIPFRQRLEIEGERWERMQDHANANRPEGMPPIYMIPGHRLMMRLYDDIAAGKAPGLTSMGELFADDIHLNAIGNYAVTALVYSVIYQRNPREYPDYLTEEDKVMSPALARYLKATAWEVANSYDRAGMPD